MAHYNTASYHLLCFFVISFMRFNIEIIFIISARFCWSSSSTITFSLDLLALFLPSVIVHIHCMFVPIHLSLSQNTSHFSYTHVIPSLLSPNVFKSSLNYLSISIFLSPHSSVSHPLSYWTLQPPFSSLVLHFPIFSFICFLPLFKLCHSPSF